MNKDGMDLKLDEFDDCAHRGMGGFCSGLGISLTSE